MFADQFKSNAVVFEVTAIANLIAGHLVIKRFAENSKFKSNWS